MASINLSIFINYLVYRGVLNLDYNHMHPAMEITSTINPLKSGEGRKQRFGTRLNALFLP